MRARRTLGRAFRTVSPARGMAFEVLRGVEERRGEPAALLHAERYRDLDPADRSLGTEIALGVLRQRGSLDWVLARHVRRPLDSLDPALLAALRIGLYQIRHLDRVPDRAAVDESVRLAHAFGASRGAGLVNAALRSVLRDPDRAEFPRKEDDPLGYLTAALSHPRWLAARYLSRLGIDDAEKLCRKQNEPPPLHLRVSSRLSLERAQELLEKSGFRVAAVPEAPRCLRVEGPAASIRESALYRDGLIHPQDAGSQILMALLDLGRSDSLLDVCAAPGGKAAAAAEELASGRVIALEKRIRRARLLQETIRRLSAGNVFPVVGDATRIPLATSFSRILVDAPCTSLGTLRRNPDVKWRIVEEDVARFANRELEILDSASRFLAPGGRLVYATCSTEPEENEGVVERFLSSRSGFELVDVRDRLPEGARRMVTAEGAFRTRPEIDDMDGYFAVALRRTESS